MPLINLVVVLMVVGFVLYLINQYVPMASSIKSVLNLVVLVAVCVWILQAVGLLSEEEASGLLARFEQPLLSCRGAVVGQLSWVGPEPR